MISSLLFRLSFTPFYTWILHFLYLFNDRLLGSLHLLEIRTNATINVGVQESAQYVYSFPSDVY